MYSILDRFPDLMPNIAIEAALDPVFFDNRLNGAANSMGTKAFMEYITTLGLKARCLDKLFIQSLINTEDTIEVLPGEACLARLPNRFSSLNDTHSYTFIFTETCMKVSSLKVVQSLLRGELPVSYKDVPLLITGPSGFGKSYVLQYLVRLLRARPRIKTFYVSNPSLIFSNNGVKNLELIISELVFSLAEECPEELNSSETGKTHPYNVFLDRMAHYYDLLKPIQAERDVKDQLQILSEAFSCVEQYCSSRGYLFIKVTDQRNIIASYMAENGKTFDNDLKKKLEKILMFSNVNVFAIAAESFMSENIDGDIEKVVVEIGQCFSDASILKLRDEIWGSPLDRQGPNSVAPELENSTILNFVVDRIGRSPLILREFFHFFARGAGSVYLAQSLASFMETFLSEKEVFKIMAEQKRFIHEKGQESLVLFMLADCAPPLKSSGVSIVNTSFIHPTMDEGPLRKRCKAELQIFDPECNDMLSSGALSVQEVLADTAIIDLGPWVIGDDVGYVSLMQLESNSPFENLRNLSHARKFINRKYMFIDEDGFVRCTSPIIFRVLKNAITSGFDHLVNEIKTRTLNADPVIYGKAIEAEFRALLYAYHFRACITLKLPDVNLPMEFNLNSCFYMSKNAKFQLLFRTEIRQLLPRLGIPIEPTFGLVDFIILSDKYESSMGDFVPEMIASFPHLQSSYVSLESSSPKTSMIMLQVCRNYQNHKKCDWKIINLAKRGIDSSSANPLIPDNPEKVIDGSILLIYFSSVQLSP